MRFASCLLLPLLALSACNDPAAAPADTLALPLRLGEDASLTRLLAVSPRDDGSTFVVGSTNGSVAPGGRQGSIDALVARVAPDGAVLWSTQLGGPGAPIDLVVKAWDVATARSGDAIVVGLVNGRPSFHGQPLVATFTGFAASFDADDGSLLWVRLFADASGATELMGVEILGDGTIVVGGYTDTATSQGAASLGEGDVLVAWLEPDGEVRRVRRYGGAGEESPSAFGAFGEGVVFARREVSLDLGRVLALELVGLDADGDVVATRPFDAPATTEFAAFAMRGEQLCAAIQLLTYSPEDGAGRDYGLRCYDGALVERHALRGGAPGAAAYANALACDARGCALAGSVDVSFQGEAIGPGRQAFVLGFDAALAPRFARRFGPAEADAEHFATVNGLARREGVTTLAGEVLGTLFGAPLGVIDGLHLALDAEGEPATP